MNIFILDLDHKRNVQYYVDKHVVKMPVETTQILNSVYYFTNQVEYAPYKLSHAKHPCCIWARTSLSNWLWLRELGLEICKEYTFRYHKIHKCEELIKAMVLPNLNDIGMTTFAQAMPNECKDEDVVVAYRVYYFIYKKHLFSWKYREMPYWIKDSLDWYNKLPSS